ncbi:MAG TPA: DNA-processing protein DprA [Polyangia bacterium]
MTAVDNLGAIAPNLGAMNNIALAQALPGAPDYPARLARLSKPPAPIWVKGRVPSGSCVAIVGARAATPAARLAAEELGMGLAKAGVAVVSGGAFGIDAAAHEGALAGHGETYAVLGCGIDVVYPDRHAPLFARIAETGGLLSEYAPGTPPRKGQFPARNRIIAALADLVIVVEAAHRSGALSTAAEARALGVKVAARAGSAGTDRLIDGGAFQIAGLADVFALLAGHSPTSTFTPIWVKLGQGDPEQQRMSRLLAILGQGAVGAFELALQLGWPVSEVLGMVGQAEIEGWIRRVPGGAYEVTRGH